MLEEWWRIKWQWLSGRPMPQYPSKPEKWLKNPRDNIHKMTSILRKKGNERFPGQRLRSRSTTVPHRFSESVCKLAPKIAGRDGVHRALRIIKVPRVRHRSTRKTSVSTSFARRSSNEMALSLIPACVHHATCLMTSLFLQQLHHPCSRDGPPHPTSRD